MSQTHTAQQPGDWLRSIEIAFCGEVPVKSMTASRSALFTWIAHEWSVQYPFGTLPHNLNAPAPATPLLGIVLHIACQPAPPQVRNAPPSCVVHAPFSLARPEPEITNSDPDWRRPRMFGEKSTDPVFIQPTLSHGRKLSVITPPPQYGCSESNFREPCPLRQHDVPRSRVRTSAPALSKTGACDVRLDGPRCGCVQRRHLPASFDRVFPNYGLHGAIHRPQMHWHMRCIGNQRAIRGKCHTREVQPLFDIH